MEVNCPECQALLRIADESAGRQTRCPSCSAVFTAARSPTPTPSLPPRSPASLGTTNPYAPTFIEPVENHEISSDWAPRQITIDEVFSNAWAIFKDQWLMACAAVLIVGGINFGTNMSQNVIVQILNSVVNEAWILLGAQIVMGVGFWLFQMWLQQSGVGSGVLVDDRTTGGNSETNRQPRPSELSPDYSLAVLARATVAPKKPWLTPKRLIRKANCDAIRGHDRWRLGDGDYDFRRTASASIVYALWRSTLCSG